MDVALRDADLNQVATLGFGVHARPLRLLVPARADVAVGSHVLFPRLPERRGLCRRLSRSSRAWYFLPLAVEVWQEGRDHDTGGATSALDADIGGLFAATAFSFSHSRSLLPAGAGNHDTFSATPSQDGTVSNSTSGGKGQFRPVVVSCKVRFLGASPNTTQIPTTGLLTAGRNRGTEQAPPANR